MQVAGDRVGEAVADVVPCACEQGRVAFADGGHEHLALEVGALVELFEDLAHGAGVHFLEVHDAEDVDVQV